VKIALIAPPFISIPPANYGGTELFIAHLAEGLKQAGIEVVVYTNGESTVNVERRCLYEHPEWPIKIQEKAWLRELNHYTWAVKEAARDCHILHVQSALALTLSRLVERPFVLTLHGPHEAYLSELYASHPETYFVAISDAQAKQESLQRIRMIHHGIDLSSYKLVEQKQKYLSFIGRIAPVKGTHIAIDVAKRSGIPLKIAGEVQPANRDYFERKIKPQLDGSFVEYIGPANLDVKNELLGNSMAMLFPIQWNEPFGLVMVEAMACGTPVLAMPGGSVREVVQDGVSGFVCRSTAEMAKRAVNLQVEPAAIRRYVENTFSTEIMTKRYLDLYREIVAATPQPDLPRAS
jgi:glycosyltransferase involved in cell wall biosynthesis